MSFEHVYPFIRGDFTACDEDGPYQEATWIPGAHRQDNTADGVGLQQLRVLTVVSLGKPYQPRVFYTQRWTSPDGKMFGRTTPRCCTLQTFCRMAQGYGFPYSLPGES